jgi:hypothetical protein
MKIREAPLRAAETCESCAATRGRSGAAARAAPFSYDPTHMTDPQTASSSAALTPSECVMVYGDRFAKPAGMLGDKEVVLASGTKVDADDLAVHAMAAAFLACEQAGSIRFEHREGKALFGLMKTKSFHVLPGGSRGGWPAGSLEDWVEKGAQNSPKVVDLGKGLLNDQEVRSPALVMFTRLKAGLAQRGLLHAESKTTLKVFTTVTYSATDATHAAARGGTEAAQRLLAGAKESRPDFWKELARELQSAVTWMTQSSDT